MNPIEKRRHLANASGYAQHELSTVTLFTKRKRGWMGMQPLPTRGPIQSPPQLIGNTYVFNQIISLLLLISKCYNGYNRDRMVSTVKMLKN